MEINFRPTKARVSHFIAKQIPINQVTRPLPEKIVITEDCKEKTKGKSLTQKLNLAKSFCTYKLSTTKNQYKNNTAQTKKKESIQTKARRLVNQESQYASIPTAPSLENWYNKLKQEAGQLKALTRGTWKRKHSRSSILRTEAVKSSGLNHERDRPSKLVSRNANHW